MPRAPITLDAEQCREVETLAALLSQEQIADYFGIARNTFRAICARDEEVIKGARHGPSPMLPTACCKKRGPGTPPVRSSISRPKAAGARPTG